MDHRSLSVAIQNKTNCKRMRANPNSSGLSSYDKKEKNNKAKGGELNGEAEVLNIPRVLRSTKVLSVDSSATKKRRTNINAAISAEGRTSTNGSISLSTSAGAGVTVSASQIPVGSSAPGKVPTQGEGNISLRGCFYHSGRHDVSSTEEIGKPNITQDRQTSTYNGEDCINGGTEEALPKVLKAYNRVLKEYRQSKTANLHEFEARVRIQRRKVSLTVKANNDLVELLKKENIWLKHQLDEAQTDTPARSKLLERENAECHNILAMVCAKNLELSNEIQTLEESLAQHTHTTDPPQTNIAIPTEFQHTDDGVAELELSEEIRSLEESLAQDTHRTDPPQANIDIPTEFLQTDDDQEMADTQKKDGFLWQGILESLTRLKLLLDGCFGASQLTFVHPPTGLKFKLAKTLDEDISKCCGGGGELSIEIISLGALESTAPQWMLDVLTFSMKQVHLFFSRISAAIDAAPATLYSGT